MSNTISKYSRIIPPGIVVRKKALIDKSVDLRGLLNRLGQSEFTDEGEIISISPLFGQDAIMAFIREFERDGLVYIDDFYAVEIDLPEWLRLGVGLAND